MNIKKRLWGLSKKEVSAISYCMQKVYAFKFFWSAGRGQEINYLYQANEGQPYKIDKKTMIKLDADIIRKYKPEKIYALSILGNTSKESYSRLLSELKKHAPSVHAKLIGKKSEPLQRKKQNLEMLLEKAEKYLLPEACFDEKTFKEFKEKMNYTHCSSHGTISYCNSAPYFDIDMKCPSAKKAEALFNALCSRFGMELKESSVATAQKIDAWHRMAENKESSLICTEGFKSVSITLNPKPFALIQHYTRTKDEGELYYTALTPLMIGFSKPKLLEIMQRYKSLGLKELKSLWNGYETSFWSDKEYVPKRKHDLHEELVERLQGIGSTLINSCRYSDLFKLASITNRALDCGDRTAKKTLYDCTGLEPDIYCRSNHNTLMKKEQS